MGTIANVFFAGITVDIEIDGTSVGFTEDGVKDIESSVSLSDILLIFLVRFASTSSIL